jgi:Ribonuclease G/E
MWFEYRGFTVHRLDLYWYLILGPAGYRGYETSENAARKVIDGVIAGQCGDIGGTIMLTATESEIIEAVKLLNDKARWLTLQQCLALAEYEMYQNKESLPKALSEFKKVGNVIYPKWA